MTTKNGKGRPKKDLPRGVTHQKMTGRYVAHYKHIYRGTFATVDAAVKELEKLRAEHQRHRPICLGDGIYQQHHRFFVKFWNIVDKRTRYYGLFNTKEEARLKVTIEKARMLLKKSRIEQKAENVAVKQPIPAPVIIPPQIETITLPVEQKPTAQPIDLSIDRAFYDVTKKCYAAIARGKLYSGLKSSEEAQGIVKRGAPFKLHDPKPKELS